MVVQVAPSVRITLAESLGYAPGTVTTGKIVHALRKIRFRKMFGAVIKTFFAEKEEIDPADICSVSVMPCTAKKFEAKRREMRDSGYQDVDISITVEELAKMIRTAGIHFQDLEDREFNALFGLRSGAGQIFGTTGGVMEAALRTVYEVLTGETLKALEFEQVRGWQESRRLALPLPGRKSGWLWLTA